MITKIIRLPGTDLLKIKKQTPLTQKMIQALQRACAKQHAGVPFGQKEIDGSFLPLINRGLIMRTQNENDKNGQSWHVAKHAIRMLHDLGVKVDC